MVGASNLNNYHITFFLCVMQSPYIGRRTVINGHSLYNALLREKKINPKNVVKVSFGISQNLPLSLKGKNDFYINIEEPEKKKTLIRNIEKGYDGFVALRWMQNNLSNPLIDNSPIPFEIIKPKHCDQEIVHQIQYFNFYIVWKNEVKDDFKDFEFGLGKARNNGFGFCRVHDYISTTLERVVEGSIDKYTACHGISGIYNHARYGFGEFILQKTSQNIPLIKLVTPLCLSSTIPDSTKYGALPSFIKETNYTKDKYYLWHKNSEHELEVINSGKVMEVVLPS